MSSLETEKRCGGRWSPTTVLFESLWTTAFHGRARGDKVTRGPWTEAAGHRVVSDPHPRPDAFRAHRRRSVEFIVLPANRSKRLCRRIQFLRFETFSFLPNFQRNCGIFARQRKPRIFGRNPLLLETLNVAAVRLAPAAGNGRADEQLL